MTSHDPIDDRRLQLPPENVFRFAQPNGLPKMDMDKVTAATFETAREIERKRLAGKANASC